MFTFFSMQKFVPLRTSATVGAGSSPIAIALIAAFRLSFVFFNSFEGLSSQIPGIRMFFVGIYPIDERHNTHDAQLT